MNQDVESEVEPTGKSQAEPMAFKRARFRRGAYRIGIELVVVALGVGLALVAQQWAEEQSWRTKARDATEALRSEISDHYPWAIEWRVVEPCILAQIDVLQQRLLASGDRLDPAPVYSEPGFAFYVMRMPNRTFEEGVWQAAISDGVVSHLDRDMRRALDTGYTSNRLLADLTRQNNAAYQRLLSLTRPIPLDAGVRYSLLRDMDELRGRVELMSHLYGQSLDSWTKAGVLLPGDKVRNALASSGTRGFCEDHGLPMRSVAEAERPVPN